MPTPMPIMAAISGEKIGTVSTCVSSSSSPMPMPSPASAVMTGRPIATTDPKASSMIRMAAVMPMPSLGPGAAVAAALMGVPPSSTRKPSCADDCAVLMTVLMAGTGMSAVSVVNWTWAKAMLPLGGDLVGTGGRERAGNALDVGQRLQAGHHLVDGRPVGRRRDGRVRLEDDVGGVPRLRGEPLLENVERLLGRRVPRSELVLEVRAHHLGDDRDPDDGQDPYDQDGPAAVVTDAGQAPQSRHALLRCPRRAGRPPRPCSPTSSGPGPGPVSIHH